MKMLNYTKKIVKFGQILSKIWSKHQAFFGKFTQNIKQCICCDDLFIRLVKPLQEESSYKNNDDEDSQFIGYDGFY